MKKEKNNTKGDKQFSNQRKQVRKYGKKKNNNPLKNETTSEKNKTQTKQKVVENTKKVNNNLQKQSTKQKNTIRKNKVQSNKKSTKKKIIDAIVDTETKLEVKDSAVSGRPFKKADVKKARGKEKKLKIISLGGLAEIGKNITVFEYGDDIVIIDAGLAFPDEDMLGIDLVIPDFSYLVANAHKIRALLITHGHEDHIGAVPHLLSKIDVPVYGTKLSLGIIEGKLEENPPPFLPKLYTVEAGDVISLGVFKAEFIHVNHSIADACAIAIRTPVGLVYHSGDFKLDVSPIDGKMMDITRIGELGREGVTLLLCESTNAERAGFTPSERTVGSSLERIFSQYENKRLIIATFSSNVHRVQQIINTSARRGRKVVILGRSMVNVIGAAAELGYIDLPDGVLIDVSDMKRYRPEEITIITTGSQGEPMSALYRIAFSEHNQVRINASDVVILSSSAIPGNEKLVGRIINALVRNGVRVVHDSSEDLHVSGHACREEIKLLMALLKPKYFMPIHGEYRHLYANKDIAEFMGISADKIFISDVGRVLELDKKSAKLSGEVPAGNVLVDGAGVGDIGSVVLRDRKHLAEDGLVVVVATVDDYGEIISGPDVVSRGFVYVKESEELMQRVKELAAQSISKALTKRVRDWAAIKGAVRDDIAKFIFKETKRRPMILPVIMDV